VARRKDTIDAELTEDRGVLGEDHELLECHLRVGGKRRVFVHPNELELARKLGRKPPAGETRLFSDPDDLLLGIEAGLAWVANPESPGPWRVLVADDWQTALSVDEARSRIAAAALHDQRFPVVVWWETMSVFRLFKVGLGTGDISLVVGGAALAEGAWEEPYGALLEQLRSAATWAVYGYIKRGRRPLAVLHSSLTYDWVPALHYGSYNLTNNVYEDVLAPDAFGAQLLGEGYAGRIPSDPDWEQVDLGNGATLVVHRDPEAWFGRPLPPATEKDFIARDPAYPTPEVLVQARETFAPILQKFDRVSKGEVDPLG
jgi:hypothetical protein